MTSSGISPKVMKGAIIGVDLFNPVASVVVFQYNPDSLTRTIAVNAADGTPNQGEALRLKGPPSETIKLEVEVDAADQLERGDPLAASMGVSPTLASLEMLLYPKSALVIANEVLLNLGIIEVIPAEAPMTFFVWGPKRVLPVRITDLSITEEAFDTSLNPIRAKIGLSLKVLTYQDLGLLSAGGALFMVNQVIKEVMASMGGVATLGGGGPAAFSVRAGG